MNGDIATLENGLYISVDWLSFTIKNNMLPENVVALFGLQMTDFQSGLNGRYGYKSRIRHSHHSIDILYDGNDDMGIHVDVTGSAIGYFLESYRNKHSEVTPFGGIAYAMDSFDSTVLSDLLQEILDIGKITRLDIAIDDLGCSYYSMDELTDIFNDGLYCSCFRKWKLNLEKGKFGTTGHSIYFGSRTSEIMFRIYDKRLERNSKKNAEPVNQPWIRWEIELHKNRATAVAMFLISGSDLSSVSIGVLSRYLRLIQRDNVRDSRCSNTQKWDSFISGIEKVKLCQPIPEKTLEDKKAWLMGQVAPTLASVYRLDGDLGFIYALVENGSLRLSSELMHIIQTEERRLCHDYT